MAYGTYTTRDRTCATCTWWCGPRRVEFINHRPYYIKAEAGSYPCQAYPAKNTRAVDRCPRWDLWEKL